MVKDDKGSYTLQVVYTFKENTGSIEEPKSYLSMQAQKRANGTYEFDNVAANKVSTLVKIAYTASTTVLFYQGTTASADGDQDAHTDLLAVATDLASYKLFSETVPASSHIYALASATELKFIDVIKYNTSGTKLTTKAKDKAGIPATMHTLKFYELK